MKTYFLVFLAVLLTGCVTVALPPQPSVQVTQVPPVQPTVAVKTVRTCTPYEAPARKKIPRSPVVADNHGDYTRYLEGLTEQLVQHINQLRDYIDEEHSAEDQAQRQHLQGCEPK